MPEDSLQQLRRQLEKLAGNDVSYQAYLDAVGAAEREMSRLHSRDRYGRIPLLTAEHRARLMELHRRIGAAAENLYRGETDQQRKKLVQKITALAAGNHRALLRYDPEKEPKSLPELLEEVRCLTVDTRGTELREPVGANQNKRQPLTFLDDQGREITGLFTPVKKADHWAQLEKAIRERAKGKRTTEAGRQYLQDFMARLDTPEGAEALGLPRKADRSTKLAVLYEYLVQSRDTGFDTAVAELMTKLFSTPERPLTPEQMLQEVGSFAAKKVAAELYAMGTPIINNNQIAKIHDGARMDNRNAAMNAVAELLNVPNLLAKSVPMKMIDKNGNVIEGTFMMEAKGVDVSNMRQEDAIYDGSSIRNPDRRVLKSIADLQVLDYICGNTDRHSQNVSYIFSERTGKLIGIQGFDNDTAFGTLVPKKGDDVAHMVLPENMMAVSESMYERLNQISPEMLKFSLRGFGLSEEELDAAVQRMQHLKNVIEAGRKYHAKRDQEIAKKRAALQQSGQWAEPDSMDDSLVNGEAPRILKDDEWSSLSWKELDRKYSFQRYHKGKREQVETEGNLFSRVWRQVYAIPATYKNQKREYRELRSKIAIGTGNRALPDTLNSELEKARQMAETLKNRDKSFHTSGNYQKMREAVARYAEFQEKLYERLTTDPSQPTESEDETQLNAAMASVITVDDLIEMQRLSRAMRQSAEDYLRGKGMLPRNGETEARHKLADYKPYTRDRIQAAFSLLDYGKDGERIKDSEFETANRNQRRALEQIHRSLGDKLEQEGWQPQAPRSQSAAL